MATPSRVQTRSKNATTHPALPMLQLDEELNNDRKAERASNKRKVANKKQEKERLVSKNLTSLEDAIANEDAINDTPRPFLPKARKKPATSKLRQVHKAPVMSDPDASSTEDPPIPDEDKSNASSAEQSSEQEWGESMVSADESELTVDNSEDSPSKKKAAKVAKKKQPGVTKKKQPAAKKQIGKKPTKPIAQKKSIQDALEEDIVDATPMLKRRPNTGKSAPTKVAGNSKRRQSDLTVCTPVQTDGSQS